MIRLSETQLKGSFPPIVTPFKNDGAVDYDSYAKLVDFQAKGGSHGIVVTGTTGEPSTLTTDERTELLKVAIAAAGKRIQVVAATGTQNHADTVAMTLAAEKAGADALLIVTPYFIRPPQRGLEAYYIDLCKRTRLPVMIYHIPGRAAVSMTADTIARIAEAAPNLVGIKHAVNDLALVSELIVRLGNEFRIHVGLEELSFPMVCLGAHGLMNAVGNLAPGKVAELYEATAAGDLARGKALHYELYELNCAVFFDTNPIPMKYMMMRMGLLPNEHHRLPMVPATPELRTKLDGVLGRAGLLK
jgi:4-hydroxy-tetrahydrodipicolinate synthase